MDADAINHDIAVFLGWKRQRGTPPTYGGTYTPSGWISPTGKFQRELRNYAGNLNVIHEAEPALLTDAHIIGEWERHVRQITQRDGREGSGLYERIIRATAAQRAEAFLRTIGKWQD